MVLKCETLKEERTPSRGGQTGPAVFRRLGRLQFFLEVFSLKEKLREINSRNVSAFWT
jgi:hypothetical protein